MSSLLKKLWYLFFEEPKSQVVEKKVRVEEQTDIKTETAIRKSVRTHSEQASRKVDEERRPTVKTARSTTTPNYGAQNESDNMLLNVMLLSSICDSSQPVEVISPSYIKPSCSDYSSSSSDYSSSGSSSSCDSSSSYSSDSSSSCSGCD